MKKWRDLPKPQGLYDPRNEHDACGIGSSMMRSKFWKI